jgi:hypothetical protein
MSQAVGDLIVNLDLNDAKFTERYNYVKRGLEGIGSAANDAALEVQSALPGRSCMREKRAFRLVSTMPPCAACPRSLLILRRSLLAASLRF